MKGASFILSLDQGTTSSRAILFDRNGQIAGIAQREFTQIYPKRGWVEHDPMTIWSVQMAMVTEVMTACGVLASSIAGIGITNQRETTVIWNRHTGKPVYNAIVWQDRRTAPLCDKLKEEGLDKMIREKTGLIVDSYFSATKAKWILDHVAGARASAERGDLCFGTVDTWLLWKLTDGKVHATDITNASRTMLFNIHTCTWDQELLDLFGIPLAMMPEVKSCSEVFGHTGKRGTGMSLPVSGVAGDQQAALFGQMCISPGMVKNTYGTGCFMLLNTGDRAITSANNLLTTVAWQLGKKVTYGLEGSVFIAGAVIQWLRDGLHMIDSSADSEKVAAMVKDNGGIYFVPALSGLGAPYWDPYARGMIIGITRDTNQGHIVRAALESIALQVNDVVKAMSSDMGHELSELRVDGGASANDILLQFQSDILGIPVIRPAVLETTALGAAYFAGLATGFWSSVEEIQGQWESNSLFSPVMDRATSRTIISKWHEAVNRASAWATEDK
ncbi:MAG TPA: glycerol kinase GlpK [Bacteroidales bacterium]|nr:glycerol kinase GlpK [Bacteroidales bacterium]